ncbi:C40 family peptidase [Aquibacillus saliphilus]|uniref:C40 family peptidase n=1 Tax=Aquibacillus saliphilus TaxID=1909422 RepID=UPI001CF0365D|nr:NlpC/P60 family protein [Aquibacillus saliphilus]
MLTNGNVQHVVKYSMAYGFVLSQPFSFYVDAYPMIQNEVITESRTLFYGEHNDSVRMLQHKLNQLSYFDKKIDGEFGVMTEYALKKLQYENDLKVTGQADNGTVTTLLRIEREKHLRPIKSISKTYYPGDKGEDIKSIQDALHYFGYYKGELDGIYGPITDRALKSFQQDKGLEIEQEVNEKTVNAIYTADPIEETETEAPEKKEESSEAEKKPEDKKEEEAPKEPKVVKKASEQASYDVSQLISSAKQHIGTPYVWGGTSPSGFDCSGFIQYVYQSLGISLPRTVSDIWNFSKPLENLSIGDFVFYETYKPGPSHMGIYLGNGQFVHAGSSNGVTISDMKTDYWQSRYLGAKRVTIN